MELKYIIYLIIGVLWVVFNVMKKKQQPPARKHSSPGPENIPPRPSTPKLPDEFTFLEELLKGSEEEEEEKKPEPVRAKRPAPRPKQKSKPAPVTYESYESAESLETITSETQGMTSAFAAPPSMKKIYDEPEAVYYSDYSINSVEEARKAIIWSEIINRPYQ